MHFVFVIAATLIILCVPDVHGASASVTPWQYEAMEAVTSKLPNITLAEKGRMAGDASYLATVAATESSESATMPSTLTTITVTRSTNIKITTNKDILRTNEFVPVNDTGELYGISTSQPTVMKLAENSEKATTTPSKSDPKSNWKPGKNYPKGDLGGLLPRKSVPLSTSHLFDYNNGYDYDNSDHNYDSSNVINDLLHYYEHSSRPHFPKYPEKRPSLNKIDMLDLIGPVFYDSDTNYDYLPDK
uniref:Secreted protein n=1 Tax=Panagrellus redivivus TaxID=6233 RepID=A0A7E4VI53_PANRE